MRFLVLLSLVFVASCSWMPGYLYPREQKEVAVPLVPAPDPSLVPAANIDQAQKVVAPQYQQQFAPDPQAVNQQQYQMQAQQNQQAMMPAQTAQAPQPAPVQPQTVQAQPQYYYAIPAQPQVLPPQYQQPYYQQPQPGQQQYYAVQIPAPAVPQAAPMLGQSMPHTFTTGKQYLENDIRPAGRDDFPAEYSHVKPPSPVPAAAATAPAGQPANNSQPQYLKREDMDGQQTQVQQVAPPLMGQPQQQQQVIYRRQQ